MASMPLNPPTESCQGSPLARPPKRHWNRNFCANEILGVDRYRRLVCLVRLGSSSVNEAMIQEGWAWAYRRYLKGSEALDFLVLEQDARRRRIGLWQDSSPQPPWEFRKANRTN